MLLGGQIIEQHVMLRANTNELTNLVHFGLQTRYICQYKNGQEKLKPRIRTNSIAFMPMQTY